MYGKDKNIKKVWESVLSVHANDIAVHYGEKSYTYKELDEKSWYVANYLNQNISKNMVGVRMESSFDYVCTVLGILKSGKCFVPLDVNWPKDRTLSVWENCDIECVIESCSDCFWGTSIIESIYEIKEFGYSGEWKKGSSAYVLHSSGTTGRPKGIEIEVESLINLVEWFNEVFLEKDIGNIIQLAKISFDVSVEEIFGTILNGKTLFIPNPLIKYHKTKLRRYIVEHNINLIELVPATLKEFLDEEEKIGCLKTVICGADVLHEELKNSIIKIGYDLYNNYGPTETTVDAMYYRCSLEEPVQLGKCITGCHYVIIDENGNKVKKSGMGEIWFAGINLAKGYINGDETDQNRFQVYERERFYKTGDWVKVDDDGRIFYCGRIDNQVKIRGQRIELEEIEKIFSEEMKVKLCAAICKKEEQERIILFYESHQEYEYKTILKRLKKRLPDYMIPSSIQYMKRLPSTDNGKVDRNVLLEYNIDQDEICFEEEYDETTRKIIDIMCIILKRQGEAFDLGCTFEQLGFDSLSFVRFLVEIESYWDVELEDEILMLNNELAAYDLIKKIKSNILGD